MSVTPDTASAVPASPETITRLQGGVAPALAMLAGMQLEIFTQLADGPRPAGELAATLGVASDRLSRLLHALVVAGLVEKRANGFANAPEAAAFLVKGRAGYMGGVHELWSQLWHADLLTAQSIRDGKPAALHDFGAASDQEMTTMLRGMHGASAAAGRDLVRRFDLSGCGSVIDVGGGSGALAAALCDVHPALHGVLFELPRNAALAEPILRATPGGERVSIETGDIVAAPPKSGMHDAVVMRALIQVLSAGDAARAIAHAAAAARPGGTIYILGGGILDDDRLGPGPAVFWNVTFMNLYPAGASYTEAEHAGWLSAAGCGDVSRIVTPIGGGIIRATKLH